MLLSCCCCFSFLAISIFSQIAFWSFLNLSLFSFAHSHLYNTFISITIIIIIIAAHSSSIWGQWVEHFNFLYALSYSCSSEPYYAPFLCDYTSIRWLADQWQQQQQQSNSIKNCYLLCCYFSASLCFPFLFLFNTLNFPYLFLYHFPFIVHLFFFSYFPFRK